MNNIIYKIQKLFLDEAINSPLLFNDLANMEKYISESYSGRSLIELLQNADDAGSKKFYIELIDNSTYIVANDGREFTDDDILALCRSGSSTKTRKSNTIGFRGIGFKSVVNYANVVHLISGNIKATFSKTLTKQILSNISDVPLIRIPHVFHGDKFKVKIDELLQKGYNTIFIFEAKSNILQDEIHKFDNDSMLFLQSVQKVFFNINKEIRYEIIRKKLNEIFWDMKTFENENINNWLVTIPNIDDDDKCSVAFKYNGEKIIEAENKEAVVHSFMPTHNELSMLMKVNGDFSTDPSRTRVIIDDDTKKAAEKCALIISNIVIDILKSGMDKYGVINILKRAKVNPLSQVKGVDINDILTIELKNKVKQHLLESVGKHKEIYLQSQGIDNEDFDKIINYLNAYGIGNRLQEKIPCLLEFLKSLGIKEIPIEKSIEAMKEIECSENTRVTVFVDAINKTRFGMSNELKNSIVDAQLIKFDSGIKKITESKTDDLIEANFESAVLQSLVSSSDYTSFIKKLGFKNNQLAMNNKSDIAKPYHSIANTMISDKKKTLFSKKNTIKKWRSVEMNVAEVLELLDEIDYVTDVSKQNLGYDLEAVLKDGSRRYYEVKSVNNLGELISITNNEYSTAINYRDRYYLAIADQSDLSIEICFIKDPINNLSLSKRVTRWEWICEEYKGDIISADLSY